MRKKNNERETVSITNKFHLMETATVRCSNWLSSFENFSCIHHFHQILSPLYVTIYIYMPSLTTYTSPIEHILCEMKVLRAQTIKRIFQTRSLFPQTIIKVLHFFYLTKPFGMICAWELINHVLHLISKETEFSMRLM